MINLVTRYSVAGRPEYAIRHERVSITTWDNAGREHTSEQTGYVVYHNGEIVHLADTVEAARMWIQLRPATVPEQLILVCSECHEAAVLKPPREWIPAWGPPPPHSHWDGEPLCAVMTSDGYRSAEPKFMEMQP